MMILVALLHFRLMGVGLCDPFRAGWWKDKPSSLALLLTGTLLRSMKQREEWKGR